MLFYTILHFLKQIGPISTNTTIKFRNEVLEGKIFWHPAFDIPHSCFPTKK